MNGACNLRGVRGVRDIRVFRLCVLVCVVRGVCILCDVCQVWRTVCSLCLEALAKHRRSRVCVWGSPFRASLQSSLGGSWGTLLGLS